MGSFGIKAAWYVSGLLGALFSPLLHYKSIYPLFCHFRAATLSLLTHSYLGTSNYFLIS